MEPEEVFAAPVRGSSFRWHTKALALFLTAVVVLFVITLIFKRDTLHFPTLMLFVGAAGAMCASCWHITRGETRIDAKGIHQDGLVGGKNFSWGDIKRARILKLPLATRLVINTGRPPFKAVYAGTPELVQAFEKIDQMLGGRTNA